MCLGATVGVQGDLNTQFTPENKLDDLKSSKVSAGAAGTSEYYIVHGIVHVEDSGTDDANTNAAQLHGLGTSVRAGDG